VEGLVNQMMEDARFPTKINQEQQIAALEASQKVLDAELAAKPGEAERAHEIALAQINEEIVLGKAAAETQQVKAKTTAKAQQAAYRSGDPVLVNAASISAADRQWLEAAALAANILF
jgi:aspartyl aminopeptidase